MPATCNTDPVARRRTLRLANTGHAVLRVHRTARRRGADRRHLRADSQQPARRGPERRPTTSVRERRPRSRAAHDRPGRNRRLLRRRAAHRHRRLRRAQLRRSDAHRERAPACCTRSPTSPSGSSTASSPAPAHCRTPRSTAPTTSPSGCTSPSTTPGTSKRFRSPRPQSTLTAILTALLLGALGTVVLATLFGLATSRRLLRPLSQVADAAADIASGGLDTRLATESDPDLDRLAGSFNDMADAVQARIEREARFASDVSHELRSPITALTAAVEVLDGRRDDIPERTQQALDVVVDQVRRFDSMVIDLLELARLDAGATDLNVEDVVARRPDAAGRCPIRRTRRADRRRQGGSERGRARQGPVRTYSRQLAGERTQPRRRSPPHRTRPRPHPAGSASQSRTGAPASHRANGSGSSNVSPAAPRPVIGSAPASVSRSSPSTAPQWEERHGCRIEWAVERDSSSSSPSVSARRRRDDRRPMDVDGCARGARVGGPWRAACRPATTVSP